MNRLEADPNQQTLCVASQTVLFHRFGCANAMAQYDVILFGATGFTGSLMMKYLASKGSTKFAVCGRNRGKLEQAVTDLASKPEILVLDVVNASLAEVKEVVKKTKCVTWRRVILGE